MIKNGKIFFPPPKDGGDFKELFKLAAATGAGRPVGIDGFPVGPWTPELLAEAISLIDVNRVGVDLRTVQLWFQENDRGISSANLRWLARVFGCDDPFATSEWQLELSAAQSRLTTQRRERRKTEGGQEAIEIRVTALTEADEASKLTRHEALEDKESSETGRRRSLAIWSEAIFSRGSPLDLPSAVFAGAVALGFISYLINIHNATYTRPDGITKQIGFLWSVNWMSVYIVLLPLYLAFVCELLSFWRNEGRFKFLSPSDQLGSDNAWRRRVEASSYTYWAVLLICVVFAGLMQWIGIRLLPLLKVDVSNHAIDWGSLAIIRPEVISISETIVFSGLAYLYMCLTFYLFFAGLILLYSVAYDLSNISKKINYSKETDHPRLENEVYRKAMCSIFRCSILGILIATSMKLQSAYLASSATSIVTWLAGDMISVFRASDGISELGEFRSPNHFSSLIIALATIFVFLYSISRLSDDLRVHIPLRQMMVVIALLSAGYLLIAAFTGFSILLSIGLLFAIHGLIDPDFGSGRMSKLGSNQSVS